MASYSNIERELAEFFSRTRDIKVDVMRGRILVVKLASDLNEALRIRTRGEYNSSVCVTNNGLFLVSNVAEYGNSDQTAARNYGIFGQDQVPLPFSLAFAQISGKYERVEESFGHVKRVLGGIKEFVVQ